jgi:maltose/maltodextrin transport system substrate-binding protein
LNQSAAAKLQERETSRISRHPEVKRAKAIRGPLSHRLAAVRLMFVLSALGMYPIPLYAWTNGSLLIWMDTERARGVRLLSKEFQRDLGVKVTVETPINIVDNFSLAAPVRKGPDIVIWAHDKVGEWADAGLIAPVDVPSKFVQKFYPQAWKAVQHKNFTWGYPIALETITLIYNKRLLVGPVPTDLSQLPATNRLIQSKRPKVTTILWDYTNAYYSWGILACGGGYVFGNRGAGYDLSDIGVATPGCIKGLSSITDLVRAHILPGFASDEGDQFMAQGKLAMTISGPWLWPELIKNGIDFGLSPIPGIDGRPARPFVGVTVAYLSRFSPNQDLAKVFLERYLLTDDGLRAMDRAKPIGVPALISLCQQLATKDDRLRQLKEAVDQGEIMPNIPQMGRFFSAVGKALQIATSGQATAKEALREAALNMRADSKLSR